MDTTTHKYRNLAFEVVIAHGLTPFLGEAAETAYLDGQLVRGDITGLIAAALEANPAELPDRFETTCPLTLAPRMSPSDMPDTVQHGTLHATALIAERAA